MSLSHTTHSSQCMHAAAGHSYRTSNQLSVPSVAVAGREQLPAAAAARAAAAELLSSSGTTTATTASGAIASGTDTSGATTATAHHRQLYRRFPGLVAANVLIESEALWGGSAMSPIAAMMMKSVTAARNQQRHRGAHQQRRRHAPRAADGGSRGHAAEIRQATARRRKESIRLRQIRGAAAASNRERDAPVVMAYPVLPYGGEAQTSVLPLGDAALQTRPTPSLAASSARVCSSGDWVPPCGGGDWVPPQPQHPLDPASTSAESLRIQAAEAAAPEAAAASPERARRQEPRRGRSRPTWLQCCSSAHQA